MSTFGVSALAGSSRNQQSKDAGQSRLEQLHQEAKEILEQKAREINEYNRVIGETEAELAQVQQELRSKSQIAATYEENNARDVRVDHSETIATIEAEQQAEMDKLQARHKREMDKLQKDMQKSLHEAESWAEHHAEVILMEKNTQLEALRRKVDEARQISDQAAFSKTQSRTNLYQQSKTASLMNSKRMQYLESQVGEITAVTREELRDMRAKIDECLAAVQIRNREHKIEADRYEHEISEREHQYNSHLQILAEQFTCERQRLEQAVVASTAKNDNLQNILKQLEKQHERQLQTTLKDIVRMKTSIYQTKTRQTDEQDEIRTYMSQINSIQRECEQTEQEIQLIERERQELLSENRDLKTELSKLDSTVYGSVRRQ